MAFTSTELNSKWNWKLPVPVNLNHFCCSLLHGSLPTNSFRMSKHVSSNLVCSRCGDTHEIVHVLVICVLTVVEHSVWFKNWETSHDAQLFIVTCWCRLQARNEDTFNDRKWHVWFCITKLNLSCSFRVMHLTMCSAQLLLKVMFMEQ
jgi:hypothetical protein